MSRRIQSFASALSVVVTLMAVASCAADTTTSPPALSPIAALPEASSSVRLLQCDPPASSASVTGLIGPLGGTLSVGNTSVVIPENAVLAPTSFRLTVPASSTVQISVKAGDAEHYQFLLPVLVTIDYSRCSAGLSVLDPLSAWNVDETTGALLENMSGTNDPLTHTMTFSTGHLSGYAVADNSSGTPTDSTTTTTTTTTTP